MLVVVTKFAEQEDHLKKLTDIICGLECTVLLETYEQVIDYKN